MASNRLAMATEHTVLVPSRVVVAPAVSPLRLGRASPFVVAGAPCRSERPFLEWSLGGPRCLLVSLGVGEVENHH